MPEARGEMFQQSAGKGSGERHNRKRYGSAFDEIKFDRSFHKRSKRTRKASIYVY